MTDNKNTKTNTTELKKQSIIEKLWLTYYNDTLFAKGIITETERKRMRIRINNRSVSMEH